MKSRGGSGACEIVGVLPWVAAGEGVGLILQAPEWQEWALYVVFVV